MPDTKSHMEPEVKSPEVDHLRGCPASPDRIESYPVISPTGEHLTVTRCLECAGHTIRPAERTT